MKITWLGHASFRIETGDQVLLLDPWLRGNPAFEEARFDEAIQGTTHILVTHGHGDHASNAVEISKATKAPIVAIFDWINWISTQDGVEGIGLNKGGTVQLGKESAPVAVTMVNAVHSSSVAGPNGQPMYSGAEAGFMIAAEGKTLYVAGDTDVMADMGLFAELHAPTHAILPIGGHFTMDAERAAFAARKFFDFKAVIPSHYATFPLLAQTADDFKAKMAPTEVLVLDVMGSVEI